MSIIDIVQSHVLNQGQTSVMSLLENLNEPIHLRQSSTTNLLSFGAQTVMDPISGSMVYPWRVNVL